MANITDIAKKAGVSISTVSRVLNQDSSLSVTENTRRKIFEIAEELNYTKYKTKKAKKTVQKDIPSIPSKTIALMQWRVGEQELEDIYYMSIRLGAEKKAQELNYNLVNLSESTINQQEADGVLCIGKFDQLAIQNILKQNDNVVIVGSNFPLDNFDTVNTDFSQATEIALNHLLDLGHTRIAFIGAEETENLYGYRTYRTPTTNIYRDVMKSLGLFREEDFFIEIDTTLSVEVATDLTKKALSLWKNDLPTAILAANDSMAIGVVNVLTEAGIKIPQDISVMGINDLSFSRYVNPPLSTVRAFTEEMGEIGMETLHNRIVNQPIARRVMLSTELVVRESTDKPAR
ncbi:LacI family transcriptional regulator [Enterococcus sp. PF1-24]|uniref:LacI family DNA-binding transcriptional regulator n=1 Tax=unclassified Enterococcus TaxID=2608891 RepID=UPI002476B76A|nr:MULTISPECIES: LacI family DNA-binding transcriptional regulator [unclassified Enterococcus]MDH6363967.1 LacI family transcriptional regulator [Enterococcus sp. PFB1-1]MDH6401068.1 LacI family transcriptional regulator [Enterococcus sp. PF1-24]